MNGNFRTRTETLLKSRGMTQRDLAARLGVSEVTVSRWLNGERNPSVQTLKRLAEILGTTPDDLLGEPAREAQGGGLGTGLKITFGLIMGLVLAAVAAGLLSRQEKDDLIDVLKGGDK